MGEPAAERDDFLEILRGPFLFGRWMLVAAETIESLLRLSAHRYEPGAPSVLAALFVYNIASLVLVHLVPIRRLPLVPLLTVDMLFVAAAAYHAGASRSPFLGQFYLIIFLSALLYGLRGGILSGIAASGITTVLAMHYPSGLGADLRDLIPYLLISGAFTGYLSSGMQTWFVRHRESLDREHAWEVEAAFARSMQAAALPTSIPRVPCLDIAARSVFAREVGGDFYLFLEEGSRMDLVLGDVSGKGTPAALAATSIAHLVPWLWPLADPLETLRNLNRDLLERLPEAAFATMVLAEVDVQAERLRLWSAGHPPAFLWRASEERVLTGKALNPLLGVLSSWEGRPEEWRFEPGDVLLLYSDGLSEARNADGVMFESRIPLVLARNACRSAEEIADALVEAVNAWGALNDDLTLLVCKRLGKASRGLHSCPEQIGASVPTGS